VDADLFPDIFFEPALGDGGVRWDEAGSAMEALEASEGVGPTGEGAYDDVAGISDQEWCAAAAVSSGVDDTERRQVAF
jgi:hypothetical protein